jgi:hypothetical protein
MSLFCGNIRRQANDGFNNNLKYIIILVIIGATGTVTKGLRKQLKAVTGDHYTNPLQKLYLEQHT